MSRRACIVILDGEDDRYIHCHCDGYPYELGYDLAEHLKAYNINYPTWSADTLIKYLYSKMCEQDLSFANRITWDHEYVYVIDCKKKLLSGYYKGLTDSDEIFLLSNLGDPLYIKDNIFDGREVVADKTITIEKPREIVSDEAYGLEVAEKILEIMLTKMGEKYSIEDVIDNTIHATKLFLKRVNDVFDH